MESQSHSMITRPSSLSQEDDDAFLGFIDYAISILSSSSSSSSSSSDVDGDDPPPPPPWSWVTSRILKSCVSYSSGVTAAILLSDLFQAWNEQHKYMTSKKKLELMNLLNTRQRRTRLPNTVTIDSIYEKNFLSLDSVLEVVVIDTFLLPGTNIYMLSLGDMWSSCTIDLYLHRRFYDYVGGHGILKKGREIFLTGCCLRSATEGSGHPRLLPTEYLIVLLDEDKDEDAMLLGAQFCTYSFSSISFEEAKNGASYSFYARIRSIESLEPFRSIQRKQISLVDNDDAKIKFLLWGEQVLAANLLSVGSMLALDRPFIAKLVDSDNEASQELCLEYGSATQIYLVPVIQHEEQVILTSTQMRNQGSRLLRVSNESQGLNASQVTLPRDSLGSIDFSKYPFRTYVIDLRDKMTGVSLYVTVTNICRQEKMLDTVFCVAIEDLTGVAVAKLHFVESWSLGRVGVGHTVYISGLTCSLTSEKLLEVAWFEKESGTSLVNLSCLPALLTSSCLQKIVYLSDVSNLTNTTHICHVHIEQIEHHNIQLLHVPCGCFAKERSDGLVECSFCQCDCNSRCMYSFQLHVTIADESGKVLAWCIGQTAAELLQISPDEFLVLPEDEQAMYLYSLQNEKFKVSLVNSKRHSVGSLASSQEILPEWEITRAQKCERGLA